MPSARMRVVVVMFNARRYRSERSRKADKLYTSVVCVSFVRSEVAVSSATVRFGFTQNTTVCFRYYAHLQIRNLRKTRLAANDDDDGVFYK